MIAIIIDIIVLAILLMSFFCGFRYGAIKSFLLLLNSVISWIFSVYVSRPISSLAFKYFISPMLFEEAKSLLNVKSLEANDILNRLPAILLNSLPQYGITLSKANHIINSVSNELLPREISKLFAPVIIEALSSIVSILLFMLMLSIGRLLINFFLSLFKIKLLSYSDKIAGGVFGAFKGYVLILVLMCIFRILAPFLKSYVNLESFEAILTSTKIFKYIYERNPVYVLFRKL